MTEWDLAFPKSFYSAPKNISAAAQRSDVRRSLTKELQKGQQAN